jgi:hypothetical protein
MASDKPSLTTPLVQTLPPSGTVQKPVARVSMAYTFKQSETPLATSVEFQYCVQRESKYSP